MPIVENKLKVLYIVEAMGGGVFSYIVDLTNSICDKCEVIIAYALRPQIPKDFTEYFDERIKLIEVKNFTRSISLKHDMKAFFEIKKIYKQVNPDIVHLNSSKAGILGRLAIDGRKVKMFYTPHGYAFLNKNDSIFKRYIYKCFEWIAAKRTCTTIACGKGEYELTLGLTKNATYINNGINTEKINSLRFNQISEKKDFKICTVGRICYQKNPELFNKIAEAFPDIHFTWIGDGEMKSKLSSLNIKITGWVDRKTVSMIMNQSNVFLLPSLWEGLPLSLLEAMYLKKICIVSNAIGNKDVIRNGENGFLADNILDYSQIINSLLNGKYDTEVIKAKAYSDVIDNYTTSVMAKNYLELYKEMLHTLCINKRGLK